MKKMFKIIAYGVIGIIGLTLATLIVVIPSALSDATKNNNWLWLYTPHIIGLLILLGWIIYTEIDE